VCASACACAMSVYEFVRACVCAAEVVQRGFVWRRERCRRVLAMRVCVCVCVCARGGDSSQGRDSTLPARGASVHISLTFSSTILQCLSNAYERAHIREGARAGGLVFPREPRERQQDRPGNRRSSESTVTARRLWGTREWANRNQAMCSAQAIGPRV